MASENVHNELGRSVTARTSSDRSFGVVFAVVFATVALLPLWSGGDVRLWALLLAAGFLLLALVAPRVLAPLNRAWAAFGVLLHRLVSPVVLGLMYFGVITPTALVMRLSGRRPLALDRDGASNSYWIPRSPPGPEAETLTRQF